MYTVDPQTVQQTRLFTWHFAHRPKAVISSDYIAQEQIKLIDYIANKRDDRQVQTDYTWCVKSHRAPFLPLSGTARTSFKML